MPGIDGWETLRRIRQRGLGAAPLAIVSANAFDKGLDNDVGIRPADFITKPVRVGELLDWLGRALALQWITADAAAWPPPSPPATARRCRLPAEPHLRALEELVASATCAASCAARRDRAESTRMRGEFVDRMRGLARQFQLDAMNGRARSACTWTALT